MRTYIAGPMRHYKYYNHHAFDKAEELLRHNGFDPVSPAKIDRDNGFNPYALPEDYDWGFVDQGKLKDIIRRDLNEVVDCDAIYMLPLWEDSKGATAEFYVANWGQKLIMYAPRSSGTKCGIYQIRNLINNKIYVGSSKNIYKRWSEHKRKLNKSTHFNDHLQSSWNKYGSKHFTFEIIQECPEELLSTTEYDFINLKRTYTRKLGYNVLIIENNKRIISEETKKKISRANKGKLVGDKNPMKRPEVLKKFFGKNNHFYGKKHTEETKRKISEANKGRKVINPVIPPSGGDSPLAKRVIKRDPKNNKILKKYSCMSDTREDGYSISGVSQCCNGKLKLYRGFIWEFVNEESGN